MSDAIQDQIAAVGFAKVLVMIDPGATGDVEAELATRFLEPAESLQTQYASMTIAAARAAGREPPTPQQQMLPRLRVYQRLGLAIGIVDAEGAAQLTADRRVERIALAPEPSLIRPVAAASAAAPRDITWGIRRLRIPELWAAGITGRDAVIGHLDTGLDGQHPALNGAISAFAEFDMAGNMVPQATPHDSGEHGTHTAGTIAGRAGTRGAIGVAPEAQLASALVIEGGQVIDRILGGLEWALSRNVRIISMSLGLRGYTPAFQVLVDALRRANVLPAFAVGNEGPNTSRSPGNYDNVLSVGAMGVDETVPDWSSSDAFNRPMKPVVPDLVGPGVDVLSAKPGGGYQLMSGSSMATPHIAGLAALLLQAKPAATADELENAIVASCSRPASLPESRAGRGVPDAVLAFQQLTGSPLAAGTAALAAAAQAPTIPSSIKSLLRRHSLAGETEGRRAASAGRRTKRASKS